ncbi:hypothetical protein [Mesoplasma lactucae]|uniref:Uncharacterized protein n=1 Tax=Mesoplasma lactucae ATCC 49193 TaxID=81460 RepID=A0A291IQV2_9MOLU|nr:hypothetical protein [Mesoplasma lactucae]ATG97232.1 hypothetical protein CP520_00440 [Mesoplasma lactucae ATCC 49193]ATZ20325.1 hypothetical protein MLACT_v1c05040 [Mesoplasma lactucae ATCC 49193]MCL8216496.1 hypothetical protein [Mesoplasma lactucae ATCC 49193]
MRKWLTLLTTFTIFGTGFTQVSAWRPSIYVTPERKSDKYPNKLLLQRQKPYVESIGFYEYYQSAKHTSYQKEMFRFIEFRNPRLVNGGWKFLRWMDNDRIPGIGDNGELSVYRNSIMLEYVPYNNHPVFSDENTGISYITYDKDAMHTPTEFLDSNPLSRYENMNLTLSEKQELLKQRYYEHLFKRGYDYYYNLELPNLKIDITTASIRMRSSSKEGSYDLTRSIVDVQGPIKEPFERISTVKLKENNYKELRIELAKQAKLSTSEFILDKDIKWDLKNKTVTYKVSPNKRVKKGMQKFDINSSYQGTIRLA